MSERHDLKLLAADALIIPAPRLTKTEVAEPRACTDRNFELPTALYVVTVGSYLAFLGVMAIGFQSPGLILPMVIFVVYVVMAFATPALWTRMKPDSASRALTLGQFRARGIDTYTGHNTSGAAAIQMLLLPVLILLWGVATVIIAASV